MAVRAPFWHLALIAICLFVSLTTTQAADLGTPVEPETETVKRIQAALEQPLSIKNPSGPLDDILRQIADAAKIPIEIDRKALQDAGITFDTPVKFSAHTIPLGSALRLTLNAHELTTRIRTDRLELTTKTAMDDHRSYAIQIYDVGELIKPAIIPVDSKYRWFTHPVRFGASAFKRNINTEIQAIVDEMLQVITATIAPHSWSDVGGSAVLKQSTLRERAMLIADCNEHSRLRISRLLNDLQAARRCQLTPDPKYKDLPYGIPISIGGTSQHTLQTTVTAPREFQQIDEIPLSSALEVLAVKYELPIVIDERSFSDAGISMEIPVSNRTGRYTAEMLLNKWLEPLELAYLIQHDVIFVTSNTTSQNVIKTGEIRVYPIADLIDDTDVGQTPEFDTAFDGLLQLITGLVDVHNWSDVGGNATIRPSRAAGSLVILQSQSVHHKLARLLTALRQARDKAEPVIAPPMLPELPLRVFEVRVGDVRPSEKQKNDGDSVETKRTDELRMSDVTAFMQELIGVITEEIAPKTWQAKEGRGNIYAVGNRLVVRQEQKVIDEIAEFLKQMGLK